MTVRDVYVPEYTQRVKKQSKIIEDCKEIAADFCLYCEKTLRFIKEMQRNPLAFGPERCRLDIGHVEKEQKTCLIIGS